MCACSWLATLVCAESHNIGGANDLAGANPCQGASISVKSACPPIASHLLCAPDLLPCRLPVLALTRLRWLGARGSEPIGAAGERRAHVGRGAGRALWHGHRLSRIRSRAIFAVDKAFAFSISRNVARGALLSPTDSAKPAARSIEAPSYWRMSLAHVPTGTAAGAAAGFVCAIAGIPAGTIASAAIVIRCRINPPYCCCEQ